MRVSILGAGPAGSTAAYYLAKNGIEVELIDRVEFPREKPCAGGLFNPLLYYDEFPHVKEAEGVYIYKVRFYCGKYEAEHQSEKPLLKMVLRRDFDYYLLKLATESGAKFHINKVPEGSVVIDATGVKTPSHYNRAGICMVYDFPVDSDIDTVHIHYGWEGITGYAWLYPKKGFANIGIGAYLPCRNIKKYYTSYVKFLTSRGIVNIKHIKYRAKLIPFSPAKIIYDDKLVKIGDAAGFVNSSTGEGIYFAMLSGKICAEAIIKNRGFDWYLKRCREQFGEYLKRIRFSRAPALLNRVLEKAVKIASRDTEFCKTLADNFFRLDNRLVTIQFLKNLWR